MTLDVASKPPSGLLIQGLERIICLIPLVGNLFTCLTISKVAQMRGERVLDELTEHTLNVSQLPVRKR